MEASTGGELATEAFETTRGGYERLVAWADRHTSRESRAWAVEGSGSYGSRACAHPSAAGEQVIEFSHPRTAATSDGAKTDALDARRAAREVLGRSDLAVPRARGRREALRALESTRRGAQTARTAAINELKALIISAPVDPCDQFRGLTTAAQVAKCAALRLPAAPLNELTATKQALRSLAPRIKTLTAGAADPNSNTHVVVVSGDVELCSQRVGVGDLLEVGPFGFDVAEQGFDPCLVRRVGARNGVVAGQAACLYSLMRPSQRVVRTCRRAAGGQSCCCRGWWAGGLLVGWVGSSGGRCGVGASATRCRV